MQRRIYECFLCLGFSDEKKRSDENMLNKSHGRAAFKNTGPSARSPAGYQT
jgi:hypothetical protein